jgi:hypothetical protein
LEKAFGLVADGTGSCSPFEIVIIQRTDFIYHEELLQGLLNDVPNDLMVSLYTCIFVE